MEYKNETHHAESGFLPFDPIVLIRDVARRWLLILLVALVAGIGTYIYKDVSYKPVYQSTINYVTYTRSSSSSVYNNLSSANAVASVFTDLLNSSILRKTIQQEGGIGPFDGTINAQVIPETNLLTVTVTASDPRTAFLVAQAIVDHHESVTYLIVDNVSLEVLQSPTVPIAPINHANAADHAKKAIVLAAAAMILLLAILSYRRDCVRSGREASAKLDCKYLGEIPHERKHKTLASRIRHKKTSILITNPITSFRFVETIRKLGSRLEYHMHDGKVLMVTSLLENEGKSTVAVNLALSMAQRHENVLLIDCDLRKPACHAVLEKKAVSYSLYDVLSGNCRVLDALLQDKKSGLYMLLEKRTVKNSGDILASENMHELLQWARIHFDYVVLDLPPMAAVSDAESIMELADASLLVVRQNVAEAAAINKAVSVLGSGRAKLLGCVLNNAYSSGLAAGQGYGHGYGYSYGHYGHYGSYGKRGRQKN